NSVQRGLVGGIPDRGRFLINSEHLCIHFQKLIVNALAKGPLALKETAQAAATQSPSRISVDPSASVAPESERNAFVELEVVRVEKESETISSFYLRRADGASLYSWEPGQFLPIRVAAPGYAEPLLRTFTLSTCCNPDFYRLSIMRREGTGPVTQFLHDKAKAGFRLEAMKPRGKFVLDQTGARPVVLVSGGVGITPMIAIAEHIVEQGRRAGTFRPIYFVHGAQNSRVHAFRKHVQELASQHPDMTVYICYSRPEANDKIGVTHNADGHVTIDTLKQLLGFAEYEFYLCGPAAFMNSLYSGLMGLGVRPQRIHFESFGLGTVLKPEIPPGSAQLVEGEEVSPAWVRFAKSMIDGTWSPDKGTLLEFAEELGLAPAFGCRSGICGTCRTRLESGGVRYLEEPLADRAEGEILLCCSVPRLTSERHNGENPDLILDL
ncbi:MAG: 2Fe-2S iron-sulfur cluster binding domain-containing protein, partial [Acidobacteriaceae bacterium]|nr:2Fe-2S iron-sulfur cluster binding domain-containing protein [Acidobacteriaceae bacterium]